MLKIERMDSVDAAQWDQLILSSPAGSLFQTAMWANFAKEQFGAKPVFLKIIDEAGAIKGLALGYDDSFSGMAGKIFRTYNFLSAPLVLDGSQAGSILRTILELLKTSPKNGTYACKILCPYLSKSNVAVEGFEKTDSSTFWLDLTQNEDTLWNNLSKTCRKGIRHCENNNVKIKFLERAELSKYLNLLEETRKRMGFAMPPVYPNDTLWKHLGEKGHLKVLIAELNGEPLAGLGFLCFNGRITEIAVAQSQKAIDEKIEASEAIKWHIMKWGHENGYRIYDLAGVKPKSKNPKDISMYFFKEKFGGQLITAPTYYKIYSPLKHAIYKIARKIKNAR